MVGWAIMALCDTTSWSYAGVASELVTGACSSIIGGPGDISGSRGVERDEGLLLTDNQFLEKITNGEILP